MTTDQPLSPVPRTTPTRPAERIGGPFQSHGPDTPQESTTGAHSARSGVVRLAWCVGFAVVLAAGAMSIALADTPVPATTRAPAPYVSSHERFTLDGLNVAGQAEMDRRLAAWYAWAKVEEQRHADELAIAAAEESARRARDSQRTVTTSSTRTTRTTSHSGGVNWDGIAQCETASNWSMTGPTFSGGLGFYNGAWDDFGGREFARLAGQAKKDQQIIVAERIYARFGLSGWGCRDYG